MTKNLTAEERADTISYTGIKELVIVEIKAAEEAARKEQFEMDMAIVKRYSRELAFNKSIHPYGPDESDKTIFRQCGFIKESMEEQFKAIREQA